MHLPTAGTKGGGPGGFGRGEKKGAWDGNGFVFFRGFGGDRKGCGICDVL